MDSALSADGIYVSVYWHNCLASYTFMLSIGSKEMHVWLMLSPVPHSISRDVDQISKRQELEESIIIDF